MQQGGVEPNHFLYELAQRYWAHTHGEAFDKLAV